MGKVIIPSINWKVGTPTPPCQLEGSYLPPPCPRVDRHTDTCQIINFPHPSDACGKKKCLHMTQLGCIQRSEIILLVLLVLFTLTLKCHCFLTVQNELNATLWRSLDTGLKHQECC